MNAGSAKAKKLARKLLRENRRGRTWREIAREDYRGRVSFATLNRFAIHKGEWLPKDDEILTALGLKKPRAQKVKRVFDMPEKELLWRLEHREEV